MKELTIEITDNCMLRCLQCSSNARPDKSKYMTLSEINEILKKFKDFESVRLSGGEPFQHPNLTEIIRFIKSRDRKITIMSCGLTNVDNDYYEGLPSLPALPIS